MSIQSSAVCPLISPTKARRDAAEAQDWAYVSSWLTKKYAPQAVPRFERNAETLAAFIELIAANIAADRETRLVQQAKEDELRRYQKAKKQGNGISKEILTALEHALDEQGRHALNGLAEASLLLGVPSADPIAMGERIIALSREKFEHEAHLAKIAELHSQLEMEIATAERSTKDIESELEESVQEGIQQRTAQLNRETKQFTAKAAEYAERAAVLEKHKITCPDIETVKQQEQTVKQSQARVRALERQIAGFHNLPPDLEAARAELKRAQNELLDVRRERDEMFQRMVGR
jgi:HAUS augmin-like complex subunit 1